MCVCTSRMHPSATYDCVSKLPMGKGGSIWLTKDICGMSFLGDGLQLVVTPAVLSVAVPGMFHHLKKKQKEKKKQQYVRRSKVL